MSRKFAYTLPILAIFALAGCDGVTSMMGDETEEGVQEESGAEQGSAVGAVDAGPTPSDAATGATPMAERVATIGLLNKRNNVSKDLELSPGQAIEEGPVIVRLDACERTAPYEFPQETGAFVQLDVLERGDSEYTQVFSGWLFKENPSLNVVEHPVYDVWIKDCAMSFPGDE